MKNNIYLTVIVTLVLTIGAIIFFEFTVLGFIMGVFYAQIIEWFVHGWIQHHPFKIFRAYRENHTYHHKHPRELLAVQPVGYFVIGSIPLLLPFFWIGGFVVGYMLAYAVINIIHQDLHSDRTMLPKWLWNTNYFKLITEHHIAHHRGIKLAYTTHSVTNPYIDMLFCKIKLTNLNNWIAKNLKI